MSDREKIIRNYLDGYNTFDIGKMVTDFDELVVFENISGGETTLSLSGIAQFREQALQANAYFSYRKQEVKTFHHRSNETEIEIDYFAIVATDLPNGMKKGDELKLECRSVFTFADGKITRLTDIS